MFTFSAMRGSNALFQNDFGEDFVVVVVVVVSRQTFIT